MNPEIPVIGKLLGGRSFLQSGDCVRREIGLPCLIVIDSRLALRRYLISILFFRISLPKGYRGGVFCCNVVMETTPKEE